MQIVRTQVITPTGALTVTVTPASQKGYVGYASPFYINGAWDGTGPFMIATDWGDGYGYEDPVGPNPQKYANNIGPHAYLSPGTFTVTLHVYDEATGAEGYGTCQIIVAALLDSTFVADPKIGDIPLAVHFTMAISGGFYPLAAKLDYGDGSTPFTGPVDYAGNYSDDHTYTKIGPFTATLTLTDSLGTQLKIAGVVLAGISGWWEQIKAWWNSLSTKEKVIASLGFTGVIVGGFAGGYKVVKIIKEK